MASIHFGIRDTERYYTDGMEDLHKILTSYNWESIPTGRETEGNASEYKKDEVANVGISAHRRMRHSMFL